jgi:hypothetical protein
MSKHIAPIPAGALSAKNDAQISLRVPSIFLERLQQIAEAEGRNVNNMIRFALYEWVNGRAK